MTPHLTRADVNSLMTVNVLMTCIWKTVAF